jgi:hypothetical protein
MSISMPLLRPFVLSLLILLLDACGGGSGGGSASAPSASQDALDATNAGLKGRLDLAAKRVTLEWYDTFATATRYQIEQQDASGAWVVIDGVWAPHAPQWSLTWTGPINGPTMLRVEALLPDHSVPLVVVIGQSPSTSLNLAVPTQIPSILLDQPEPLESSVNVSLANDESIRAADGSSTFVTYRIDTTLFFGSSAPGYLATLQLAGLTTGTHLISATVERAAAFTLVINRNVQIHSSNAAVSVSTVSSPSAFDFYAVATSDSGISSVTAALDLQASSSDTLTMPNACLPQPCGAGQPFNAYRFSFNTKTLAPGFHAVRVEATDNAGKTGTNFANFSLPVPPAATLDAPLDEASVAGMLHLAGMFSSGVPGALELMVTLSGVPIYDTTVANTGAEVPYMADVSLAGVAPGRHTVSVYTRVGNTVYTAAATAVIQVVASQ